jgi:hypothetical protein
MLRITAMVRGMVGGELPCLMPAAARAVAIAFNTAGASPARAAIALDTVGSDATRP